MTIKQKSSLGWITANQYISESSLLPTFIRTTDRQSFRVQQLATELSFRPGVRMSWNLLYIYVMTEGELVGCCVRLAWVYLKVERSWITVAFVGFRLKSEYRKIAFGTFDCDVCPDQKKKTASSVFISAQNVPYGQN